MDTFTPDVRPTVELTLRDESGIGQVIANFLHVAGDSYMSLQGDGNGQTEARIFLRLSSWSTILAAGEYQCQRVEATDVAGNRSVHTRETHPELANERFLYQYPSGKPGDTEGPELIG
jgi:hypothetical protein